MPIRKNEKVFQNIEFQYKLHLCRGVPINLKIDSVIFEKNFSVKSKEIFMFNSSRNLLNIYRILNTLPNQNFC